MNQERHIKSIEQRKNVNLHCWSFNSEVQYEGFGQNQAIGQADEIQCHPSLQGKLFRRPRTTKK